MNYSDALGLQSQSWLERRLRARYVRCVSSVCLEIRSLLLECLTCCIIFSLHSQIQLAPSGFKRNLVHKVIHKARSTAAHWKEHAKKGNNTNNKAELSKVQQTKSNLKTIADSRYQQGNVEESLVEDTNTSWNQEEIGSSFHGDGVSSPPMDWLCSCRSFTIVLSNC